MKGRPSGGTLSEIYQNSRRLLLRTMDSLERLEFTTTAATGGGLDSPKLSTSIKRDIIQIQSFCVEMDRLWRSIGAKSQRDLWRRKVEQVAEEAESLKESFDKYFLRNQKRMMEAKDRAELLGRADVGRIICYWSCYLSKYSEQRERLKKAQRKALDVLNNVGLSNSVLKLIERRHRIDKLIKYAGMIATVVIMYAFWRWTW